MTAQNPNHRPLVALHLSDLPVPALLREAGGFVSAMTGNPVFASPTPSLATVSAFCSALTTAEVAVLTRARGTVAVRDEKRAALLVALDQLKSYVQAVADGSPETAASIIESAGMAVRKVGAPPPRLFSARHGAVSGSVVLVTSRAAERAAYDWRYSADGGVTWTVAPSTLQSRTTLTGLAPRTLVTFQVRAVLRTGETDWSQPVSLVVV